MNILFFCNNIPDSRLGGIDTVSNMLAYGFREMGYGCFCAYVGGESRENLVFKEVINITLSYADEKRLGEFISACHIDVLINQRPYEYGNIEFIHRALAATACKIVTVFHSNPGWETFQLRKRIPFTTWKQKLKHLFFPLYYGYVKARTVRTNRKACEYSDAYVLLSEGYIPPFMRKYGISPIWQNKLHAIPNALRYKEILSPDKLSGKQKEVLIVARLDEHSKRLSLALRIWHEVENRGYGDWKLTIVGHGPDEMYYRTLADELQLKNISFEGRQEPLEYYRRASIFMMTSAYEGWGITLLEAQQMGVVPVVFDSYVALHDIVGNGVNGIIVENGNLDKYVEQLTALMKDDTLRHFLAENALKSCQRFAGHKIINQWVNLFNDLKCKRSN